MRFSFDALDNSDHIFRMSMELSRSVCSPVDLVLSAFDSFPYVVPNPVFRCSLPEGHRSYLLYLFIVHQSPARLLIELRLTPSEIPRF